MGDPGLIPGSGRSPGEGNGSPIPVFLPGESHGQRSLEGYSPWGRKELDTKFVCFFIMCCSYLPNYTVGFLTVYVYTVPLRCLARTEIELIVFF